MGRPEKTIDPQSGAVQRFAYALRKLREAAGNPAYRLMARDAGFSAATLSQAAAGKRLPSSRVLAAYVRACGGNVDTWLQRRQGVVDESARHSPPSEDGRAPSSPYRGLTRFEPGDEALFFGRDQLVSQLSEMASRHRISAVVGASGSGKSSLLRAGLIPCLRRPPADGAPPAAAVRILTPGPHPLIHADKLAAASGPGETWLLVDQFEELFTLCVDAGERATFLERLLSAREEDSRLRVVLAIRADFFASCAEHAPLAAALKEATLLVGAMDADQVRAAVVKPATAHGLTVERALTARVVDEVAGEPGALPLMSHALQETWRRRTGRTLTLDAYDAAGGLHGAIARTAEDTYRRLTAAQADLARHLMLRLVTPGSGTEDTHRPASRAEFANPHAHSDADADADADADEVLDQLARARLLILDDNVVLLAHEALLTAWPRLHGWITADRERLRVHRQLTHDALAWRDLDRDPGALYRGTRLTRSQETFATAEQRGALTPLEAEFLDACTAAREAELRRSAQSARRSQRVAAAFAVLCVLALVAGTLAVIRGRASEEQRRIAVSREQAARADALMVQQPDEAALLAVRGYRTAPTLEARSSLLSAYAKLTATRLSGHTSRIGPIAFAPDGRSLATAGGGRSVKVWDVRTARLKLTLTGHSGAVDAVAFTPDGRTLASGDSDNSVRLWDARTGRRLHSFTEPEPVHALAFSPDGRTLAAGSDRQVRLRDAATGRTKARLEGRHGAVWSLAFSPDGDRLVTGADDNIVRLWDLRTRGTIASLPPQGDVISDLVFSPTGRSVAFGGAGVGAKVWDLREERRGNKQDSEGERRREEQPAESPRTLEPADAEVSALAYLRGGDALAVASGGDATTVRDTATGETTATYAGAASALAVAPDDRTLAAVSAERPRATLWDLRTDRRRGTVPRPEPSTDVEFRDGGRKVAVADSNGGLSDWNVSSTRAAGFSPSDIRNGSISALSPDGHTVATARADGTLRLRDHDEPASRAATVHAADSSYFALAFSPDGRTLASGDTDGNVRLWDTATLRRKGTLTGHRGTLYALAFSPDGRTLATAGEDAVVRLWNTRTRKPLRPLRGHTALVHSLAFGPDGHTLASGGEDRTVRMWDTRTSSAAGKFTTDAEQVLAVAFSPDGKTIAATETDRNVRLWNTATRTTTAVLSSRIDGPQPVAMYLDFAPRGGLLATASDAQGVRLWETDPSRAAAGICELLQENRQDGDGDGAGVGVGEGCRGVTGTNAGAGRL